MEKLELAMFLPYFFICLILLPVDDHLGLPFSIIFILFLYMLWQSIY